MNDFDRWIHFCNLISKTINNNPNGKNKRWNYMMVFVTSVIGGIPWYLVAIIWQKSKKIGWVAKIRRSSGPLNWTCYSNPLPRESWAQELCIWRYVVSKMETRNVIRRFVTVAQLLFWKKSYNNFYSFLNWIPHLKRGFYAKIKFALSLLFTNRRHTTKTKNPNTNVLWKPKGGKTEVYWFGF